MKAFLEGVLVDVSSPLDNPSRQELDVPAGETLEVDIVVEDSLEVPVNLTASQLLFTVKAKSTDVNPIISRQATITDAINGVAFFPLVVADTLSLAPGPYVYDVWLTDGAGARNQVVPYSPFFVQPSLGQPGQTVTAPASQSPLALGPKGDTGATGPTGATGLTGQQGPAGPNNVPVYTNSGRPAAGGVVAGTLIFNSTSKALNTSDGTNWRDALGNLA